MKSLLVTADFTPIVSGISTAFYNIWKHLSNEENLILAPKTKKRSEIDTCFGRGLFRKWIPLGNSIFKKIIRTILFFCYSFILIKEKGINLLICGQPVTIGAVGFVFKKIFGIKYHVWVYGGETIKYKKSKIILSLLKKILSDADKVIAISGFTRQLYIDFGINEKKIVKILPGVDIEVFKPDQPSLEIITKYRLEGKKIILTVSRLVERKGHDLVIKALAEIEKTVPDIVYLIIGTGPDEKRLKKIVNDYSLQDRVIFTGYIDTDELPRYYNICDVYVMPNRETEGADILEGFGISFIEASSSGKPVIGGLSGGASEAVQDNITGYLVDPFNSTELSKKIIELLTNKELSVYMGRNGRETAVKNFRWENRALIVENLLKEEL